MDDPIFGSAFEKSPVGMALLDSRGMILEVNPALCNTIEKDAPVLRGGYLDDHMNSEDGRKWRAFYRDFVNGLALDYYFEAIFYPSKPREAWWSIQLGDLNREVEGQRVFFAVIQDITLKKVNEYRLKEARINAERASRAKSQFLANMSHEIRTPIHTITGMAELLLDSDLGEQERDYARQVSLSADVLVSLIEDVLDFSKIEAGRMVLENAPFDLLKILDQSLELVSLNAFKKKLELILFVENRMPHLLVGDAHRLRQVIVNLLANAVKFTAQGEISLNARLVQDDGPRATIEICVRDTGIGLEEHVKENLFEAFYQGDSSTTRKYGGTGLGLAISRRLVKMMAGDFHVESTHGAGSAFTFTFTMEKQPNANVFASLRPDFFEASDILVVEENATTRSVLERYLTDWGCRVKTFGGQADALAYLRLPETAVPSAVLISEGKQLDPWALAGKIRQDGRLDSCQLTLMAPSGRSMDAARNRTPALFDAFLAKPIKRQELVEVIFRGLNKDSVVPVQGGPKFGAAREPASIVPPSGRRIVVAEDNDVNRELFNLLLRKMGHEVYLAANGAEAVDLYFRHEPDLVFMDLQMPEMNGFEASSKIRKSGSQVPIVAVTASALKGEMERCLKSGMNDFITKPFKSKDLTEVLDRTFVEGGYGTSHLEKIIRETPADGENSGADGDIDPLTIFNADEAVQTFLGKKDVLQKLLSNFLPKVETHLGNIRNFLAAEDYEGVFKEAHAIKGSALNLSANDLGNTAAALEKAGRNHKAEDMSDLATLLERAFARFKKVAEPFINS